MMKISKNKINNIKENLMKNSKVLISIVVLLIMLVAATIAWYVLQNTATINPFSDTLEPFEFIVTSVDEADANEAENRKFSITPAEFSNVTSGKMAPGTYGTTTIYIRSNLADSYAVYLDDSALNLYIPLKNENGEDILSFEKDEQGNSTEIIEGENVSFEGEIKEVEKSKVKSDDAIATIEPTVEPTASTNEVVQVYDMTYLIKKHFRFYVIKEDGTKEEFTSEKPYTGKLETECNDQELKNQGYKKDSVTICWEWLYDAYDYLIPDDETNPTRWTKPGEPNPLTEEELSEYVMAWDYEDNFISKYVNYMNGEVVFTVTVSQVKPVATSAASATPTVEPSATPTVEPSATP